MNAKWFKDLGVISETLKLLEGDEGGEGLYGISVGKTFYTTILKL